MFNVSNSEKNINKDIPWTEKYRPEYLKDIVGQEKITDTVKKLFETKNLPHLLFYGPPGTGKTSTILSIARDLYGRELMKERVIELNASQERGIKVVRNKINSFASNEVCKNENVPPYKIIILDEADTITHDAQTALRRSMEINSEITRFCIICNYITNIIDPITSRCCFYRFDTIKEENFTNRLQFICEQEKVSYDLKALKFIYNISDGDLRNGIHLLQYCSSFNNNKISEENLLFFSGYIDNNYINNILINIENYNYFQIKKIVKELLQNGYSSENIIRYLLKNLKKNKNISEIKKADIAIIIAESEKKISNGSSEYLNLLNIFFHFIC